MNQPSSAFSVNTAHWGYIRPGLGRTGRSLSENNFAKERREWLSILLREVFQNALDARDTSAERVEVTLRNHPIVDNNSFLSELLPDEHLNRFNQSVPHLQQIDMKKVTNCLVVEDFGTSGLTGSIDNPELDGEGQNWNAFWFREGRAVKNTVLETEAQGKGRLLTSVPVVLERFSVIPYATMVRMKRCLVQAPSFAITTTAIINGSGMHTGGYGKEKGPTNASYLSK